MPNNKTTGRYIVNTNWAGFSSVGFPFVLRKGDIVVVTKNFTPIGSRWVIRNKKMDFYLSEKEMPWSVLTSVNTIYSPHPATKIFQNSR